MIIIKIETEAIGVYVWGEGAYTRMCKYIWCGTKDSEVLLAGLFKLQIGQIDPLDFQNDNIIFQNQHSRR